MLPHIENMIWIILLKTAHGSKLRHQSKQDILPVVHFQVLEATDIGTQMSSLRHKK